MSNGVEFDIHCFDEILHSFVEELLRDEGGCGGMVAHGLSFLSDSLPYRCVGEADCGWIRCGAVNATFMWDEVHPPSEYVHGLMKPFRVHGRVSALHVAPSGLPIVVLVVLVPECDAGDVVLSDEFLERFGDGRLRLSLWKVIRYKSGTNF